MAIEAHPKTIQLHVKLQKLYSSKMRLKIADRGIQSLQKKWELVFRKKPSYQILYALSFASCSTEYLIYIIPVSSASFSQELKPKAKKQSLFASWTKGFIQTSLYIKPGLSWQNIDVKDPFEIVCNKESWFLFSRKFSEETV